MLDHSNIQTLRLKRQYLSQLANEAEYCDLFRKMAPFQCGGWVKPGTAPALPGHASFNDCSFNDTRRSERKIMKGRFGTKIGFVAEEDWELYACLYRKEKKTLTFAQREMLEFLRREGPLNIGLIKEYTGMLVKNITPILHQLQASFLVYEDEISEESDRAWYVLEDEFPDIDLNRYSKTEALCEVLLRYANLMVFFDESMAEAYYRLSIREIQKALHILKEEEKLAVVSIDGKEGFILPEDKKWLQNTNMPNEMKGVRLLQRNDFLISSLCLQQKQKFTSQWEALVYLLIDGEIRGIVAGKYKFGPHLLEDIVLDLPEEEALRRREEIIEAVYQQFSRNESPIHRYCGIDTGE